MTNNKHVFLYPMLHSQFAKSSTFLLVWIKRRVIQLCQKVLSHWAGITAKWCELPVREVCWQYSQGGILTALIAKAPTTLGAQAPWWLNSQCSKYLRRRQKTKTKTQKHDNHILSTYPVFPWLWPNLSHLLSLLPNRNSPRGRRRSEKAFWQGIINIISWRGLGQTVNCSSIREHLPALSAPLHTIRWQPHNFLARISRKTLILYWSCSRTELAVPLCSRILEPVGKQKKGKKKQINISLASPVSDHSLITLNRVICFTNFSSPVLEASSQLVEFCRSGTCRRKSSGYPLFSSSWIYK